MAVLGYPSWLDTRSRTTGLGSSWSAGLLDLRHQTGSDATSVLLFRPDDQVGESVGEAAVATAKIDLEKLRRKRFIDAETSRQMIAVGFRQAGPLDGLLCCSVCAQPTVWKNSSGEPIHLWCSDVGGVK